MNRFDFYDPGIHEGELPVRVLEQNIIFWFEKITPDFISDVKFEVETNSLDPAIQYHVDPNPITEIANISPDRRIHIYENFNEFLWTVCYSIMVLFDEGIQQPIIEGKFTGHMDLANPIIIGAYDVFQGGLTLKSKYDVKLFFDLPNPEKYLELEKFYVEKTNGAFVGAMTFVLLHEFAHQYLGHLSYYTFGDSAKDDEINADAYAIQKMSESFDTDKGATYKVGIVLGLCSLILLSRSLRGGTNHPDPEDRIKLALEKLNPDQYHYLWGYAGFALQLWQIEYGIRLDIPDEFEDHRDSFYKMHNAIKEHKKTNP